MRVGRVLAGLSLGLHLLQRLDVLRPQLPQSRRRGGRREPGANARAGRVVVDDVAFLDADHAHAIADEIDRRKIRKEYYLETRSDLLLRHREVFRRWRKLGLRYIFLGLEALDDEGLRALPQAHDGRAAAWRRWWWPARWASRRP